MESKLVTEKGEGDVATTSEIHNQRKNDRHKNHFCIYCKKEVKRISEHLSRKHRDEEKVKAILQMTSGNEKRWAWKKLAQEGDNFYNERFLDHSTPKTVRKPTLITKKRRYTTCKNCFGRIRTSYKKSHEKLCSAFLKKEKKPTEERKMFYISIIEGLKEEIIEKIIKSKLLLKFIEGMWEEKGSRNRRTIREKIKTCLILEEGLQCENKTTKPLKFFFKPRYVDSFMSTIKALSGLQVSENEIVLQVPTKAQRLCRITEQFGDFLRVEYIKKDKTEKSEEINRFLLVFKSEAEKKVRNLAENTLRTKKLEAPIELPKATQIGMLIQHLKKETDDLMKKIVSQKNERTWRNLAENILLRLTIFNRRRGGAVEKMKLQDFKETGNVMETLTEEFVFSLKPEEKEFLKNMKIIEIKHKCDNIIAIYIDGELRSALEALINLRSVGKINKDNPYVFAAGKASLNAIRCVDVLAKYRKMFPPELRKQLTATNLRKQGATAAQVLNLSEQDLEEWAGHMGHSALVHKRYYRCKEKPNSILKTGRILSALNKGTLKHYKGKNLEEIPLESKDAQISVPNTTGIKTVFSQPGAYQEDRKCKKGRPKKVQKPKVKTGIKHKKDKEKNQRKRKQTV